VKAHSRHSTSVDLTMTQRETINHVFGEQQ